MHGNFHLTLRGTDLRDPVQRAADLVRRAKFKSHGVRLEVRLPDQSVWALIDSDRITMAVETCSTTLFGTCHRVERWK
jgi:hypothetical protein